MKKNMNNKKVLAISIVAVVVLVIAIIATSYAIFTANLEGTQENKLNTGYVTLSCTETNFNVEDTNPMTDAEGIAATENTATCNLVSTMAGTMTIGYDIAMTDVDSVSPDDSLGEGNVKIQAYKSIDSAEAQYLVNTTATTGVLISDIAANAPQYTTENITGYTLDSATIEGNHTVLYTIKAWVATLGDGAGNVDTATAAGTCSDGTSTTEEACTTAGGTWTAGVVCSDEQYTDKASCEAAGEIWGTSQSSTQEGGTFNFKLIVDATQVFPDEDATA